MPRFAACRCADTHSHGEGLAWFLRLRPIDQRMLPIEFFTVSCFVFMMLPTTVYWRFSPWFIWIWSWSSGTFCVVLATPPAPASFDGVETLAVSAAAGAAVSNPTPSAAAAAAAVSSGTVQRRTLIRAQERLLNREIRFTIASLRCCQPSGAGRVKVATDALADSWKIFL